MRKVTVPGLMGFFVLFTSLGANSTNYTQTVIPAQGANGATFAGGPSPAPYAVSVGGGRSFSFYGHYNASLAATSGVGLNIAFDGTKIQNVVVDQVLTKCLIQVAITDAGTAIAKVQIAWADTSRRADNTVGWPGVADPPDNPPTTYPCLVPPPPLDIADRNAYLPPATLFRFTATTLAGFTSGFADIVITTSGKSAPFDPVNDTTSFIDQTLRITGIVAPACDLNVDGSTTAPTITSNVDGILIKRALNTFLPAANITLGVAFPATATRTDGAAIRAFVLAMGNVLDVDGQGATTPQSNTDGKLIQNALNTFLTSTAVSSGITTSPAGRTGAQIRGYMNAACGTSLSTAP